VIDHDHSLLADLVGEELASVIFVRDYVQLDVDGQRLSLYVWPGVATDGDVRHLGDPVYRDALCRLIGRVVTSTEESREAGLVIHLGAYSVTVKPKANEVAGPEIAMLQGIVDHQGWMCGARANPRSTDRGGSDFAVSAHRRKSGPPTIACAFAADLRHCK
jgi:hypothetical protein